MRGRRFVLASDGSRFGDAAAVVAGSLARHCAILTAFVAIGAIIAIGFTATLIFERTRIPDLLILIFLGLLLGPIALTYLGISFVPPGVLEVATPYFTAIALMIILFDGGLHLRLGQVVSKLSIVGLHTGVAFLLTIFAIALVAWIVLGYDWIVGLLLGAILGLDAFPMLAVRLSRPEELSDRSSGCRRAGATSRSLFEEAVPSSSGSSGLYE